MNVKEFVDSLFRDYEETQALAEFKEELCANIDAKIESLVKGGMGEAEAFEKARDQLGDVSDLAAQFAPKKRDQKSDERRGPKGAWGFVALGNGDLVSRERDARGFDGVALECACDARIYPGEDFKVVITADSNLIDSVVVETRGGVLHIGVAKMALIFRPTKLSAEVYLPDLRKIKVAGSGAARVGDFSAQSLEVSVAGSGDVDIGALNAQSMGIAIAGSGEVNVARLNAGSLDVSIAGSGDVEVGAGSVTSLEIAIKGSGDVDTTGLCSREASVSILGSGDAKVWAEETLDASISGSGDIGYKGSPRLQSRCAGSGKIRRL
ncbi:MAG: DUF2807 domain-containing protein [Treponema sp.]|nr:DUF2807 domain-containing protein [Treponema sp.]